MEAYLKPIPACFWKILQNPDYRLRAYVKKKAFFNEHIFGWGYIWVGLKAGWIFC